jgi:hypothetical protein
MTEHPAHKPWKQLYDTTNKLRCQEKKAGPKNVIRTKRTRREDMRFRPSKKKSGTPGPKPEVLRIDDDWKDAVRQSLLKRRPPERWPK